VRRPLGFLLIVPVLAAARASAQAPDQAASERAIRAQDPVDWHRPFPPFQIAANLYYVGTADLASYLFKTSSGDILINTDYPQDVPMIRNSVTRLGFKFNDIKIVLLSHAHDDHVAGTALVLKETGARLMVMDGDAAAIESGTTDFQPSDQHWIPVKVDRVLHDGDSVELGGTRLVAHRTAGHTKGCTTWTAQLRDGNRALNVVVDCSVNVIPAYKLVNDSKYPQVAQDFEKSFSVLKSLPCDIWLSAHAANFDMKAKYAKLRTGRENPFIDPTGYQKYIVDHQTSFQRELKRQEGIDQR
jgi:metallo-beta-lactamase class B